MRINEALKSKQVGDFGDRTCDVTLGGREMNSGASRNFLKKGCGHWHDRGHDQLRIETREHIIHGYDPNVVPETR